MVDARTLICRLRKEVLSGKTTCDAIIQKLTMAIEAEYLKETPNMDFISACEDFLWEVSTQGKQKFVTANDRYLAAIKQHIKTESPTHAMPSFGIAKRFALIVAAFAVLIFLTQGAIRYEWFTQHSSSDEQQYIIQGHNINIELISHSIAEHNTFDTITTTDWEDFKEFLGFVPTIIDPVSLGASDVQYTAFIEPDVIMIITKYTILPIGDTVVMTMSHYLNSEEAYFSVEQDEEGKYISVCGSSVYTSTNKDANSFTWITNSTVYRLAGSLSFDHGLSIVTELIGACR